MDQELTKVIFRKCKDKAGEIIAVFPQIPAKTHGYDCLCYTHQGLHSSADYKHLREKTRLATPDEYQSLKWELEAPPFNYRFTVAKKSTYYDTQLLKNAQER